MPFPDTQASWADAEDWCREVQGTLAAITSSRVHSELSSLLVQQGLDAAVWVGANETEDMWRWITGNEGIFGSIPRTFTSPSYLSVCNYTLNKKSLNE